MPMEHELLELLGQSVTWEPRLAKDQYGNNTYGTAVSVDCRIDDYSTLLGQGTQPSSMLVGQEDSTIGLIIDWRDPYPGPGDRITLPDERVVYLNRRTIMYDETDTPHHIVIGASEGNEA